jgi:import inner membrane translocase subunit TIM17
MNTVPCPGRIIVDLGDGFSTGCVLGSIWYFAKGAFYSVRRERFKGGIKLLSNRAAIVGGSFAMWACIFSISNCIMVYFRGREDPVNSVIAGFSTGFVLAIRGGFRNAIRSGIVGGLLLGIIEIMMVMYGQSAKRQEVEEINRQIMQYKREMARRARLSNKGEDKAMVDSANRL